MNYERLDNILRQHTDSEERHLQGSMPVSYTHLDVYKRQIGIYT